MDVILLLTVVAILLYSFHSHFIDNGTHVPIVNYLSICIVSGSDYADIVIGLPFSDSITRQCVNITILQDGIVESVEMLSVNILSFSPIVTLNVSTAPIIIVDSDSEICLFTYI